MRIFVLLLSLLLAPLSQALELGDPAPGFKLPLLTQKGTLSLSQYRGKVVYLDFWASWCGPCRKSLPLLNDLRQQLQDQPFEVLAINLDEDIKDARQFLKQFPVSYPTLHDSQGDSPQRYQVRGMPTSYLIDKQGKLRAVHAGFKPSDMKKIRRQVSALLEQ